MMQHHGCGFQKSLHEVNFSQTPPSRSGFDSEWEVFRADLNLNIFDEIGFIGLMGCLILNVPIELHVCTVPVCSASLRRS